MNADYLDTLEDLNDEQRAAVLHSGTSLLILAGAGSGKTRVITTKIAYLIQKKHYKPYQILAVTFTKKAAKEMQERAIALEPSASETQIKTFHSFGAWFLRRYADEAGLSPSFTVYDDDDSASLLANAVPSLTKKQAVFAAHKISLCKDYCLTPDDDLSEFDSDGKLPELYRAYERRLRDTGNADFGDLIMLPVLVLQRNEAIRSQMQHRFRVIMVDEYQDSNVAQFKLLQALSGVDENSGTYICVVGDDDQSIYKFRGAEVQNILQFPKIFPGTEIIRLEKNYRSTGKILAAADAVVGHNENRLGKTLVAKRGEGTLPVLAFLENQDAEAQFVSSLIKKSVEQKEECRYSDFAVLYRTNAQSLGFESEFLRRKIPYVVVGSLKFYEREEIKDTLAYLALIANPRDEIAFKRIANKPVRGVGEKSQDKIINAAHDSSGALLENFNLLDVSNEVAESLPKKARSGVNEFCSLIKGFRSYIETVDEKNINDGGIADGKKSADGDAFFGDEKSEAKIENAREDTLLNVGNVRESEDRLSIFLQKVVDESGLLEYHHSNDEIDGTSRVANIDELINSAVLYPCTFQGLLDFLDSIELDRVLATDMEKSADAVTLITLHNTKGLEFPRVIITGLENGIFPREDKIGADLEEERRLFYVGITRAKDRLYITSCASRRLYGRIAVMKPSRFLDEAGNVFKVIGEESRGCALHDFSSSPKAAILEKYKKGTMIFHDDFGYGQVISADASSGEAVIVVHFENGTQKKFLPEYQGRKLEIIKD